MLFLKTKTAKDGFSKMKQYKVGFTAGVFDVFHKGHLNLIKKAKEYCDFLIVGVNSDDLVKSYKNKTPMQPLPDRIEIVESIRYVDKAVEIESLDKVEAYKKHGFDVVFIGDDWKGSDRWNKTEAELKEYNVDVIYLPYTKGISSTEIRNKKDEICDV